ncbi:peptide/nitrate transporter [Tolypocladium capitatum]|uniref:Peptide/nitrate transporter n=1 Tax=Tolypocladium capitatum TaxID=45235 RepID=A0A2K3QQD4_9HYPO|nr:peptide/nitrate transporter [Tolypocladium capitatum]
MPSSKPDTRPGPPSDEHRDRQGPDATETTPLLTGRSPLTGGLLGNGIAKSPEVGRPLPKLQILLLCYARMMEPIGFFSIFPYIGPMVARNGRLPDSDVGFYSGLIESLFSATQMVVLIFWGRLADRVGRKPVLVYSLVGMAVGPALFGMASSIWEMILFRCLAGVFSGSSLIIRTMIGDHSTPETQAVAFSWFAFAGNVGLLLGPLIGGVLADPANQYPGLFGGVKFFADYPYALPGFVIGAISATGAIPSALFLQETLKKDQPGGSNGSQETEETAQKTTIWQLAKAPGVGIVLWTYGHVMALAFAFTAILPVALFTPVHLGGIGCSSFQISLYMAAQGASQALWLLLAFPVLQRRVGTKGVLRMCALAYPVFFAGYVVMNSLLRQGSEASMVWFWIIGSIIAFVGPGIAMAFTGVQLALNDVSPNPSLLGTLNALAMTFASAIRSVTPGVATAIYAVGVHNQILAGHLAWVLLIPISAALSVVLRWLPNDKR